MRDVQYNIKEAAKLVINFPGRQDTVIDRKYAEATAAYYDDFHSERLADTQFWVDFACRSDGPVLEIGCGTGRVGLEIVRRGQSLWGVDNAPDILEVFRRKLMLESPEVQARAELRVGDLRTLNLNRVFPTVIVPFRPFQHMFTLEDQLAAFATARRHLIQGGKLGFDVYFPNFSSFGDPNNIERLEREWLRSDGLVIRRYSVRRSIDKVNQIVYTTLIFRTFDGARLIAEESSPLDMSYYTYPHLSLLLRKSGFLIEEEYGSFDKGPLSLERELILIARAI